MNSTTKILGINLLILLAYTLILLAASGSGSSAGMNFGILMMMAVPFHAIINLILAVVFFIKKDNPSGVAFLISMAVVGVVGFSSCLGGLTIVEG